MLCLICRWEIIGSSDEVEYSPFPVPKHGLPVKLWREENSTVDRKGRRDTDDDVEDIIV
jgi:(+)-abscisic acid 8'-hydroxylase